VIVEGFEQYRPETNQTKGEGGLTSNGNH